MTSTALVLLLAGGLAAIHLFVGQLRFLDGVPRRQYLSLAGGVAIAYVFVHILPTLTERQSAFAAEAGGDPLAVVGEHALFLVALAGFAAFYGLERLATRSRREADREAGGGGAETRTSGGVFWLHVGSFALYNAFIGYHLLHRESVGAVALLLYATAIALHFVVNDHSLREHHRTAYTRVGRWVLAAAVLAGVLVGIVVPVPERVVSVLLAFLAGGIILNVVKEELPEQRRSSFPAFGTGVAGYGVFLLFV